MDFLRRRIKTLETHVRMQMMDAGQKELELSAFVEILGGNTKRFCTVFKTCSNSFVGGLRHAVHKVCCYSYVPQLRDSNVVGSLLFILGMALHFVVSYICFAF